MIKFIRIQTQIIKVFIVLMVVFGLPARWYFVEYGNKQTITATIIEKERDSRNSLYLVFTDKGTFRISDQFFYMKFNSSDLYGDLKKENTYQLKVTGYRVPFLSWYPNIVSYKEVNNP